ncbi:hypothetical protein BJX62DRAFT_210417 [Aspergillus germanicus]
MDQYTKKLPKPARRGLKGLLLASLENRMSNPNAQRFRKLQHETFGLREDEWTALHKFLALTEAIGVAIQREAWFALELKRASAATHAAKTHGAWQSAKDRHIYASRESRNNPDLCAGIQESLVAAVERIRHTPIYRALYHRRKDPTWYHHPRLTERCIKAGGCCGRACGCCWRNQDSFYHRWKGHRTPACSCCMDYNKLDKPIAAVQSPLTLPYSLRPTPDDEFNRQMMDVLFWDP